MNTNKKINEILRVFLVLAAAAAIFFIAEFVAKKISQHLAKASNKAFSEALDYNGINPPR
ncbi:MAG: hypothetical protein ACH346_08125 [Chthoniobacterales bacterium]